MVSTPAGWAILAATRHPTQTRLAQVLGRLTPAALQRLTALLARVSSPTAAP